MSFSRMGGGDKFSGKFGRLSGTSSRQDDSTFLYGAQKLINQSIDDALGKIRPEYAALEKEILRKISNPAAKAYVSRLMKEFNDTYLTRSE